MTKLQKKILDNACAEFDIDSIITCDGYALNCYILNSLETIKYYDTFML